MKMKKITESIAVVSLLSVVFFCPKVLADENNNEETFIEHDYVTGEEKEIVIEKKDSLQAYSGNEKERISLPHSVNEIKDEASVTNILPNKTLTKVNVNSDPYCCVTYLCLGRDNDGDGIAESWSGGTGFMVYSDIMLTAGHCMYGLDGGNVKEMRVYKMQNNSVKDKTYYYPATWWLSTNYKKTADSNYDWCVVELQNSIGNTTGWFGYGVALYSKSITVSGYPDYPAYHYYQYKSSGTLTKENTYRFSHTCSTLGGESGSPAFDSNGVVWGIHTSGGTSENYGCLITSSLFDLIESVK